MSGFCRYVFILSSFFFLVDERFTLYNHIFSRSCGREAPIEQGFNSLVGLEITFVNHSSDFQGAVCERMEILCGGTVGIV